MPDQEGNVKTDVEDLPESPLHAYGDDRDEDVKGDAEALRSSDDPKDLQQDKLEGDDEPERDHTTKRMD